MIHEEQLKGMIDRPERQLLWDIRELLRSIDSKLSAPIIENKAESIIAPDENKPKPRQARGKRK